MSQAAEADAGPVVVTHGRTIAQKVLQCFVPAGQWTSSQWRQYLAAQGALAGPGWASQTPWITVAQAGTALSIIARTPAASEWIDEHFGDLARAVVARHGKVIELRSLDRQIAARDRDPYLWQYQVPKLVVAKRNGQPWDAYAQPFIAAPARARLIQRISDDLTAQARCWGLLRPASEELIRVTIIDDGRPMPITNAVATAALAERGVTVLARLDMRIVTDWRLEGEWQAGLLAGLGFGRLFRDGYAQQADLSAMHLGELNVELEERT